MKWKYIKELKDYKSITNIEKILNTDEYVNIINRVENENNEIKKELKEEIINLTKREKQILSYLLSGKTNKEVALILDISLNTVNNHVANIYDKSGVKNRVELVNKFSK